VPPLAEIASVLQTDFGMMRFGPQQWKIHSASSLGAGVPQIGIVAAIAIPSLLRARMSANEASAAGSLKTLAAAQTDFNNNSQPHTFADSLQKLGSGEGAGDVRYIDEALASGFKSGYEITMVAGLPACSKEAPGSADAPNSDDPRAWDPAYIEDLKQKCEQAGGQLALYGWRAEAHPIEYRRTGIRSFFIDETGILLGGDNGGKPGTPDLPEL
jgi:type II secretory pathway pseudopilin PulG